MSLGRSRLLCIDFDQTLVKGHFHSELVKMRISQKTTAPGVQVLQPDGSFLFTRTQFDGHVLIKSIEPDDEGGADPKVIASLIESPDLGPKNPNEMSKAIKTAIDNGHQVAILSFTLYPEVIKPALQKILGEESSQYIDKICIVGGFPSHNQPNNSPDGKKEHIQTARDYFQKKGFSFNNQDIMLVDDTENNINMAKADKMVTEWVPKDPNTKPTYFKKILEFVEKPKLDVKAVTSSFQIHQRELKEKQAEQQQLPILEFDKEAINFLNYFTKGWVIKEIEGQTYYTLPMDNFKSNLDFTNQFFNTTGNIEGPPKWKVVEGEIRISSEDLSDFAKRYYEEDMDERYEGMISLLIAGRAKEAFKPNK